MALSLVPTEGARRVHTGRSSCRAAARGPSPDPAGSGGGGSRAARERGPGRPGVASFHPTPSPAPVPPATESGGRSRAWVGAVRRGSAGPSRRHPLSAEERFEPASCGDDNRREGWAEPDCVQRVSCCVRVLVQIPDPRWEPRGREVEGRYGAAGLQGGAPPSCRPRSGLHPSSRERGSGWLGAGPLQELELRARAVDFTNVVTEAKVASVFRGSNVSFSYIPSRREKGNKEKFTFTTVDLVSACMPLGTGISLSYKTVPCL